MCGIFGYFSKKNIDKNFVFDLANKINYRGPDSNGYYYDQKNNFYLFHKRLSIIDTTSKAHQPMISNSGRYIIVYNGEIYNFLDLKKEIEIKKNQNNFAWKSSSDTEVLLELIDLFGLDDAIKRIKGMFSFCIFDKKKNEINLVRDRFGEKPLYYGWINKDFFFSSDLNVIKSLTPEISNEALSLYFRFMYIPSPYSIYKNIYKLEAGHNLKIVLNNIFEIKKNIMEIKNSSKEFHMNKWFDRSNLEKVSNSKINKSPEIVIEDLINQSVRTSLVSDVPIGSFLSGGIDSSLITLMMQKNSSKPIETFSIEQSDEDFNEGNYAREIASIIGTNHNSYKVNKKDILNTLKIIPNAYSEPFADSSQIPTLILSEFAKKKVTVCLTGDGGDELFGGYNRHIYSHKIWKYLSYLNPNLKTLLSNTLTSKFFSNLIFEKVLGQFFKNTTNIKDRVISTLNKTSSSKNFSDYFLSILTEPKYPNFLIKNEDSYINSLVDQFENINLNNDIQESMMLFDLNHYLTDDILCKVDRGSMYYSLETRVPFLTEEIFNFSKSITKEYKIRGNKGKIILRNILYKYFPKKLIDRKKMGFSIPLNKLLNQDLKKEVSEMIFDNENLLKNYLDYKSIAKSFAEFSSGKDYSKQFYALYNLISWAKK